jgi:predicted anti-sigma-YlaC factor YlaD
VVAVNDCPWWEQVSAGADGELAAAERAAAEAHAATCPDCSASLRTPNVLRPSPHAAVETVSSGASVFDQERLSDRERRWLSGRWARRLLAVVAIVIVVDAIPTYISGHGVSAESHAARHLAAWQIGFGVGLFVAAWVSRLSHAMLAFAMTFATLTVVAKVIDLIGGHRGPWADPVHLVELIGVVLLWRLTPPHLLPWHRTPTGDPDAGTATQHKLRLVRDEPQTSDRSE